MGGVTASLDCMLAYLAQPTTEERRKTARS